MLNSFIVASYLVLFARYLGQLIKTDNLVKALCENGNYFFYVTTAMLVFNFFILLAALEGFGTQAKLNKSNDFF